MAAERDVTGAFVALADTLAADMAAADFHELLITLCAELLQVSAAGLLLADGRGALGLAAAAPGRSSALEMAQLTDAEGPGLDCHRTGAPVICTDLAAAGPRWPLRGRRARGRVSGPSTASRCCSAARHSVRSTCSGWPPAACPPAPLS